MENNSCNKQMINISLNHTETDSTFEYDLVVDTSTVLKHFSFKKNQIEIFPRLRMHNESDAFLFTIFDYVYLPSEGKIFVLLDEWRKIKLYQFSIDSLTKKVYSIKEEGKLIFSYKIRQMDTDLFQANSLCLKYVDNDLILMASPPHPSPGRIFLKIPLNEYQTATKLNLKETEKLETEKFDPNIYTASEGSDSIRMILKEIIKLSSYSDKDFRFNFVLSDEKSKKTIENKGKVLYLKNRYFFCMSNNKKIIIQYENFNWIFSEYKEIPIDPTVPINISL